MRLPCRHRRQAARQSGSEARAGCRELGLILQELVLTKMLRSSLVEKLLQGLADRKDYLLGIPNPTWSDLKDYTFPD